MPSYLIWDLVISIINIVLSIACVAGFVCFIIGIVKIIKNRGKKQKNSGWKLLLILPIALLLTYGFSLFSHRISVKQAQNRWEEYRNSENTLSEGEVRRDYDSTIYDDFSPNLGGVKLMLN